MEDFYHDGELVVGVYELQRLKPSNGIFLKLATVFETAGDIESAIAICSTIAYTSNEGEKLKQVARILAKHAQWDLCWATWQRIHFSALDGSSEPGYARFEFASLLEHCRACVNLGFSDQAIELAAQVRSSIMQYLKVIMSY